MAGLVYKQATPGGVCGARPLSRRSGARGSSDAFFLLTSVRVVGGDEDLSRLWMS
jgi:hypothetical protein